MLIEHLDVAYLLSKNDDAVDAFLLTVDGDAANKFWHKYVSKGKSRRLLHSSLKSAMGEQGLNSLLEYMKQEEKILGMVVHPSIAASQMAMLPRISEKDEHPFAFGCFGEATVFSERTLAYAVYYMLFYIADGFVPEQKDWSGEVGADLIAELQAQVFEGRQALVALIINVVHYWSHPKLAPCDGEV